MKLANPRVGCLPYSQHARATATVASDGSTEYSDWWGYEITMVELLARRHNFSIVYDPPKDGLWGALEASGNMSGLIGEQHQHSASGQRSSLLTLLTPGQAAYGEVDFVLSGVMTTRDRYNVADSPVAFDSDYMVFVSPPPKETSKAVAPYTPFNAYVGPVLIYLSCVVTA